MPERPSTAWKAPADDHHDAGKDGDAVSPGADGLGGCHWYLPQFWLSLTRLQMNGMWQRASVTPPVAGQWMRAH
jgi:hypothetical protein